jgi:hypothetical protein
METAAFICEHIFQATRPICLVARTEGGWQLLCGPLGQDDVDHSKPRLVGLNHLLARDPTLREILDLPDEYEASRSAVGAPWIRRRIDSAG